MQALFDQLSRASERNASNLFFDIEGANARAALGQIEFPTSKSENWKYTRTAGITSKTWITNSIIPAPALPEIPSYACSLVFVNGILDRERSQITDIQDVELLKSSEAHWPEWEQFDFSERYKDNPFLVLNSALAAEGAAIRIGKNASSKGQIGLTFITSGEGQLSAVRNLIIADENAELTFSIRHIGMPTTWQIHNTAFLLRENAKVHVDLAQEGAPTAHIMTHSEVKLSSNTRFTLNTATLKGKFTRNDVRVEVLGNNTEANLNGFYMPAAGELVDNHTVIDHVLPHSQSNETYRGILSGNGIGVFNGKVFVRQDAQKTNAFQSNANILLSDDAVMNSKPELEIYADDVKCSHGSTTGQLDSDALFYLRTRGLSFDAARKTLVQAFAAAVIEQFSDSSIVKSIDYTLRTKLA